MHDGLVKAGTNDAANKPVVRGSFVVRGNFGPPVTAEGEKWAAAAAAPVSVPSNAGGVLSRVRASSPAVIREQKEVHTVLLAKELKVAGDLL